jgi:hypothetical protein
MRPAPARPRRHLGRHARAALAAVALAAAAPSLGAQSRGGSTDVRTPVAEITPYAGYMTFGNYLDGPLGTNVRGAAAPVGGAQLSVRLAPGIALVGNAAYSSGDLEVGLPILGGLDVGSRQSWLYDAGVELRMPASARSAAPLVPFLQLGAGAITTRLGSAGMKTSSTNAAFNAGAGIDFSLGGTLGVRAMVKDYVGRFQSEEVAGMKVRSELGHNVAGSLGIRLSF